jgi:asparagine synthase (glutamine-hydrolysing)
MRFSESMVKQIIPTIPFFYDEPFADSSQIPTLGVCKAASGLVTVALTGDAGDELFGGYNRYLLGKRVWNKLKWMPFTLRKSIGSSIQKISIEKWDKLSNLAGISQLGDKAHKLAFRLEAIQNMEDLYWSLVTEFKNPEKLINGINNTSRLCAENNSYFNNLSKLLSVNIEKLNLNSVEAMMYCDSKTYLSDDILCKVDRASMACSFETRVPFLDFRLIELSWRLPQDMKIRDNQSKWAIRQILYKYVPKELIDRPKAGFGVPIGQWLRGSLRKWAEELIDESKLKEQGFFDSFYVNQLWVEHQSFKRDHTNKLWAVLMFQAWLTSKLIN